MTQIIIGKTKNGPIGFDLDTLLRTRALVQGNSGAGKSWIIRKLAEQLFGKVQVIILDREGEFATLREKFGYVLVGKGGETPADCRSAGMVAHKLLELKASAVCDLYEMKESERHRWVKLFLDAMIDSPKALWHPVVIIVDEIHSFCPEKGESEAADSIIGIATRGRKRGFCLIGATQRLGKFRKDAAAELMNILVGMTFIDIDRERAADALGIPRADRQKFFDDIKVTEPGNFWALGRAISKDRVLAKIGPVQTTHAELGSSKHAAGPPPTPDKVKELLPKLADLPKAAEERAKTEVDLRTEIRSLKAQLAARPKETVQKIETKVERVEVPVLKDGQVKELTTIADKINHAMDKAREVVANLNTALAKKPATAAVTVRRGEVPNIPNKAHGVPPGPKNLSPSLHVTPEDNGQILELDKAERAILSVLAQYPEGCEIGKLALLSGYRVSGGFRNALSSLRTWKLMVGGNTEIMTITEAGTALIGDRYTPLPQGPRLIEYWLNHRSFGKCEKEALKALVERPEGLTIEDLAAQTGYEVSGGFRNALSTLRTAGVVTGKNTGVMKACDELLQAITA